MNNGSCIGLDRSISVAEQLTLHIEGMDCADCAVKLEKAIGQLDGVEL